MAGSEYRNPYRDDAIQHVIQNVLAKWFQVQEKEIQNWPSCKAFAKYIESSFQPLSNNAYIQLLSIIDDRNSKQHTIDYWLLYSKMLDACHTMDANSYIDDILEKVEQETESHASGLRLSQSPFYEIYKTVAFAVLCWSTMTLKPRLASTENLVRPWPLIDGQIRLTTDCLSRPIAAMFQMANQGFPQNRWQHPVGEPITDITTTLHVTSLNYYSLKNLGSIRIKWVDNVYDHLDFDAKQRELSIFRFPTFCVLSSMGSIPPMISRLLKALYNNENNEFNIGVQAHQELLMSYRVLFGRSKSSCSLVFHELCQLKKHDEDTFDELLFLLCTKSRKRLNEKLPASCWPKACLDSKMELLEDSTYNAKDAFPLFGQRLVKLQEFIDQQAASGWKDLWKDKRDPSKYWTFWAVLIFGGISILLSLLQLMVGVLQLWLAWK